MKNKPFIFSLSSAIIYWLLSNVLLYHLVLNTDSPFPDWLDSILLPGCLLGLVFEVVGGVVLLIIGQVFSFVAVFAIFSVFEAGLGKLIAIVKNKTKHTIN